MNKTVVVLIFACFTGLHVAAQDAFWSFDIQGGIPVNIPAPLVVRQDGQPTIRLTARYRAEPFVSPGFYVIRGGRWQNDKSWELEFAHHKIFLKNMPPEIEEFSISHGYNILTMNRAMKKVLFQKFKYILRLGAGVVIAHPETTIRGLSLDQEKGLFGAGYYISGPVLNITMDKRLYFLDPLFINLELKVNPSVSWVPVEQGQAIVWNFPFTFAFGMGVDLFKGKSPNPASE